MPLTYVVTGAASGIGRATAELLRERGNRVIGVDIQDADIVADLAAESGRSSMVMRVRQMTGDAIDGIVAIAGLASPTPATVAVNYFGMVATLERLRPMLGESSAPRAAGVASIASLQAVDDELVRLMLAGEEDRALRRAAELAEDPEGAGQLIYGSSKAAFARWVRRHAATDAWAGEGIPLNAVAPGVVRTPMTEELLASEESARMLGEAVPMPLGGVSDAATVGSLLAWLVSEENTHMCGQIVFVDGGAEVLSRGDSTW